MTLKTDKNSIYPVEKVRYIVAADEIIVTVIRAILNLTSQSVTLPMDRNEGGL